MNIIEKVRDILFHPGKFFSAVDKEKGLGKAFRFFFILSLISAVLSVIISSFWSRAYTWFLPFPIPKLGLIPLIQTSLINYALLLGASFLIAWFLFIWLRVFRGRRTYSDAYKLYAYSVTPKLVFGWIPIVNLFVWIYSLVLIIIGTNKMYKFSNLKATLIYIVPWAVILLLVVIVALLVMTILLGTGVETF
ncbi:MAG: YIP1 family protein [Candidatus Woesearchaeota archaeon]